MGKVKQLTLDRYEHGLMVRALYDSWKRTLAENAPTEDIEGLLLKVINAPGKRNGGYADERINIPPRRRLSSA